MTEKAEKRDLEPPRDVPIPPIGTWIGIGIGIAAGIGSAAVAAALLYTGNRKTKPRAR